MGNVDIVRRWFEARSGGSLMLPDGWYGRPYDNLHCLTSVSDDGRSLTIELDDHLTLRFDGRVSITRKGTDLVLSLFDKLVFKWRAFGTSKAEGVKEFSEGEVRFASAHGSE
jgi:hypothetical protein